MDTFLQLRTDGEETIDNDDDLPVCNVRVTRSLDEKVSYMHICMQCNADHAAKTIQMKRTELIL